jgi:hypothetical protein
LQKSATTDWGLWAFCREPRFDALALTVFTQLPHYATHRTNERILGASWTKQPQATEPQDALQMCKPHLDLLALASRLLKARGASGRRQ